MNPHVAKKLVQAVSNRYFRRVRCVMEHRTAKDRRRTMHWERVLQKWERIASR